MKKLISVILVVLLATFGLFSTAPADNNAKPSGEIIELGNQNVVSTSNVIDLNDIPSYIDEPYVVINNNVPFFESQDLTTTSFEYYSDLDNLKRCGVTLASIGKDIMPTEPRGNIGSVKPTGWQTVKYDNVDGKYLYNRCHLIGFQLAGENANEKNLITGTRYLNVEGMLPFENMVADYVKETDNHVLYRVTPIFDGDNLVATGVLMEAYSVEDDGDGILFNVFCYNVQPGVEIDYATGLSKAKDTKSSQDNIVSFVLNTNSKKFHKATCSSASSMKASNRQEYKGTREDLLKQGYVPCKTCNP